MFGQEMEGDDGSSIVHLDGCELDVALRVAGLRDGVADATRCGGAPGRRANDDHDPSP